MTKGLSIFARPRRMFLHGDSAGLLAGLIPRSLVTSTAAGNRIAAAKTLPLRSNPYPLGLGQRGRSFVRGKWACVAVVSALLLPSSLYAESSAR